MLIRETVAVLVFAGLAHAQWSGDLLTLSQEAKDEDVQLDKPSASTLNLEFKEELAVGFNFGDLQFTGSMWTDLSRNRTRPRIDLFFLPLLQTRSRSIARV